jgi:hypothetical protein
MNTYAVLIVLSILVIFSYLFDLFAKRTKFPSVLLLLGLGAGLRQLFLLFEIPLPRIDAMLPLLGSVGLILIVFEGALGLQFHRDKLKLIRQSFLSAFVVMLVTIGILASLFFYFTGQSWYLCLVNAIPYSVISSAIAIPSVQFLKGNKREFIIYESSFSDILGIMFFNYLLANPVPSVGSVVSLISETVILLLVSIAFCFLLMFLMGKITHHIKFFLIISIMILTYSVGKEFHFSTLIIVLVFGFFLGNQHLIRSPFFKEKFQYDQFHQDFEQFEKLTAESAFLIRTFFFLLFGFTIHPEILWQVEVLQYGLCVTAIVYVVRGIYLRWGAKLDLHPELFVTPRGLISVLLFLSIPSALKVAELGEGLLIFSVLSTCIIMMLGLISYQKT